MGVQPNFFGTPLRLDAGRIRSDEDLLPSMSAVSHAIRSLKFDRGAYLQGDNSMTRDGTRQNSAEMSGRRGHYCRLNWCARKNRKKMNET